MLFTSAFFSYFVCPFFAFPCFKNAIGKNSMVKRFNSIRKSMQRMRISTIVDRFGSKICYLYREIRIHLKTAQMKLFTEICSAIRTDYELASHSEIEKLHRNCSQRCLRKSEMQSPFARTFAINLTQTKATTTIERVERNEKRKKGLWSWSKIASVICLHLHLHLLECCRF